MSSTSGAPARERGRRVGRRRRLVVRALPYLGTFTFALLLLLLPHPGVPYLVAYLWAGIALAAVLVAVELTVPWHRLPPRLEGVVALLTFLVIALVRNGSGGSRSILSVLVMLPVVWIALYGDRLLLGAAIAVLALMFLVPIVWDPGLYPVSEVSRGLLVTAVAAVVGATLQWLVSRERARRTELRTVERRRVEMVVEAQHSAEELQEQRALTQMVIDSVDVGIAACNAEGEVTFVNRAIHELLKVPAEFPSDLLLTTALDVYEVDGVTPVPRDRNPLLRSLGGEVIRDDEAIVYDTEGQLIWLSVTSLPIRDSDGEITGAVASVRDVTERNEARTAADRLKDEFIALVSHELRTPLASILGYLEVLEDDPDSARLSAEQRRYLGVIDRNARRLLRLVGDLLFTAQVEAGTVSVHRNPVDLAAVLDDAVLAAQPRATAAGVEVALDVDADDEAVSGTWSVDAERIGQAVDNLISNAIKFTPSGGQVTVRLATLDGAAILEVADTGIGISPEAQANVFDRFYRADEATRAAIPGVGLGLAIGRAIATAHGGDLRLVSSSPQGSTFRITLPATAAARPLGRVAVPAQPAPRR